jgi:hypothetical protein
MQNLFLTNTVTLTAGSATSISLSGINANIAAILILIRSSLSYTASAIATFADINGTATTTATGGLVDIRDSAGTSIFGTGNIPATFLRGGQAAYKFPGSMTAVIPHYWFPFCTDLASVLKSGENTGMQYFDGTQFLYLTPGTGFTTGTYNISVLFLSYQAIAQGTDGKLKRVE